MEIFKTGNMMKQWFSILIEKMLKKGFSIDASTTSIVLDILSMKENDPTLVTC